MIFVTVGVQLPFDRLVRAMDLWAEQHQRKDVLAQIGQSNYRPRSLVANAILSARAFRDHTERCDFMVAHAGIGSILAALQFGKPIIIMPRRADLREHRNDHQVATAKRMAAYSWVRVAEDEDALVHILNVGNIPSAGSRARASADDRLLATLREFISAPSQSAG